VPKRKLSLSGLRKKAWKIVSEYVRRKDADQGGTVSCYTCGRLMFWRESQAGHAIGGRTNSVLLDVSILRVQCVGCNVFKRGNYPVFTTRLIKENGMSWWEKKLSDSRQIVKLSRADLEDIIRQYKSKLEAL
jgi:hypothetical protein